MSENRLSAPTLGHTEGPWTARILRSGGRVTIDVLEAKRRRGSAGQERATVVAWPGFDSCDQSIRRRVANARLIAAAPDLLAVKQALRDLIDAIRECDFSYGQEPGGWMEKAEPAIDAAEAALARALPAGEGK